jgi:hypothetical protein
VYEKATILIHDVKKEAIPDCNQFRLLGHDGKLTKINKIKCELVNSLLEFLYSNSVDREACEATREVSIHNLLRKVSHAEKIKVSMPRM